MNVKETLAELVRIDSVSARTNSEIVSFLAPRLERLGLRPRVLPYADDAGVEKFNLVAVAPRETRDGEEVELALVGHTDTVLKPQNPFIFSLFRPQHHLQRPFYAPDSHKIHTRSVLKFEPPPRVQHRRLACASFYLNTPRAKAMSLPTCLPQ